MPCKFALMPCSRAPSFPCMAVTPARMIGKEERNQRMCFKRAQKCLDYDKAILREKNK